MSGSPVRHRRPRPLVLILRLIGSVSLGLWLAKSHGRALAESTLPLLSWVLSVLDDHFQRLALDVVQQGPDSVFRWRVALVRPLLVGGQIAMPHPESLVQVTTTVGTFLQPLLALMVATFTWPASSLREWLMRMGLMIFMALSACVVNTPLTLWAYVWDIYLRQTNSSQFSTLLVWLSFLNGGGRILIGLMGAALAISLAEKLNHRLLDMCHTD